MTEWKYLQLSYRLIYLKSLKIEMGMQVTHTEIPLHPNQMGKIKKNVLICSIGKTWKNKDRNY